MELDKALQALFTTCAAVRMQQPVLHCISAQSRLSAVHSSMSAIPLKRSKASTGARADFGSAVFADAFFFGKMLCRNVLPVEKNRDDLFSPKTAKKHHSLTRTSLAANMCTAVDARKVR